MLLNALSQSLVDKLGVNQIEKKRDSLATCVQVAVCILDVSKTDLQQFLSQF